MSQESEDKTTQNWLKEAQKGYIRMGVLILLNKKPAHGYEIMKEINSRTKGFWQPTPGGVYPILRDLEKSGFIKGQWQTQRNRRLKVYKISKSGDAILRRAILKQNDIFDNISSLFREFAREVLNVEPATTPIPEMPSPFSPFLEEENACPETVQGLEVRRKKTVETLKTLKDELRQIDNRLAELKRQTTPESTPSQ
jgi:PadR family transcriptional regulator, regulatory protein PadR